MEDDSKGILFGPVVNSSTTCLQTDVCNEMTSSVNQIPPMAPPPPQIENFGDNFTGTVAASVAAGLLLVGGIITGFFFYRRHRRRSMGFATLHAVNVDSGAESKPESTEETSTQREAEASLPPSSPSPPSPSSQPSQSPSSAAAREEMAKEAKVLEKFRKTDNLPQIVEGKNINTTEETLTTTTLQATNAPALSSPSSSATAREEMAKEAKVLEKFRKTDNLGHTLESREVYTTEETSATTPQAEEASSPPPPPPPPPSPPQPAGGEEMVTEETKAPDEKGETDRSGQNVERRELNDMGEVIRKHKSTPV